MSKPLLSLCMPTNGVIEWVFPVLESIYNQNVDSKLFEVIITDNGNNQEFKEKIKKYITLHSNIIYIETTALPFLNEIEAYNNASGDLIKFINHRTKLIDGTMIKFLKLVNEYKDTKPIFYFSNGVLKISKELHEYNSFDLFVRNLSYWSSWSTGMTIWKSDFEKMSKNLSDYNELFPHTNILFNEKNRNKYIIDNTIIFEELPINDIPKARYDLFYAFCVEYPEIILNLMIKKNISINTFLEIKKNLLYYIASLYIDFIIKKKKCSYDLSSINKSISVFYSKNKLRLTIFKKGIFKILKRRF